MKPLTAFNVPQPLLTGLALVLLSFTLIACGKQESAKTEARVEPPRPVRYIVAGESNLNELSFLPGSVQPRYEQRYGFRVGGKMARRDVETGQMVKAGQVLAVLDSQDVLPAINAQNAQVLAARTQRDLQISELNRQKSLHDKGFISAAALERQSATTKAAQAQVQAAEAQLLSVQNGLNFQTLRADKAGVVTGVDVEAGSVVAAGQTVVRVAQLGEKEVVVNVPERLIGELKQARGFSVRFEALPGKTYRAQLRELSPAADAASRTYSARLLLESAANADENLKLGMSATARIELEQLQAIVVPLTALYTRDNTTRVWLVDASTKTVKAVTVTTGETSDSGVIITAGVKPGDWVVTAGANLLLEGQQVRVLDASATTAPTNAAPATHGSKS